MIQYLCKPRPLDLLPLNYLVFIYYLFKEDMHFVLFVTVKFKKNQKRKF